MKADSCLLGWDITQEQTVLGGFMFSVCLLWEAKVLVLLIFSGRAAVGQQFQTCSGASAKQITPALHPLLLNHFLSWGFPLGEERTVPVPGSSSSVFRAGVCQEACLGCSGVSCASVDLSRAPQHFFNDRGIRCLCVWVLLGYIRHCSNQILPPAFPKSCCRDTHTLHTGMPGHLVLFAGGFKNLKRWDPATLKKKPENWSSKRKIWVAGRFPRFVLCYHFPIGKLTQG